MPKAKVESVIELKCHLCPKEPDFSDVSHLLTHISSKSHLAHRFNLQIRSQNQAECKVTLEKFENWYQRNNLDSLLSDRMAAKAQKTKAKKSRASNASTASMLSTKKEKKQKEEKRATPEPAKEVLAHTPVYRAPVPRMHQWDGADDATHSTPVPALDQERRTIYATPSARRQVPGFTRPETPVNRKIDPELATPWMPDPEDSEYTEKKKTGEKLTDSAKLKGIIWPGMDLFDSATPEMKRMRNQRKDDTVIKDMMATSRGTVPDEVSYHPNGDFRASRDIFGPLSAESSPVRSVPTPKKRKTRKSAAAALSDVSVNAPRIRASRGRMTVAAAHSPQKRSMPSMQARPNVFLQPAPVLNPLAAFDQQRFVPSTEEDEEFRLAVGDMGKKRNFSIFQDIPENSPGRTETPLEEHRFDFQSSHGLATYHNNSMNSTHTLASPTPVPKPTTYRAQGKENGQPEMHSYHHNRRALSDSQVYPTHAFYDATSNPLFSQSYARSFTYTGQASYNGYNDNRSPNGFGLNFLSDYNKQPNPMAFLGHQQGHGMGSNNSGGNNAGMNGFGI